jgi:hypothetical protein
MVLSSILGTPSGGNVLCPHSLFRTSLRATVTKLLLIEPNASASRPPPHLLPVLPSRTPPRSASARKSLGHQLVSGEPQLGRQRRVTALVGHVLG